jgi:hypothetical protein
VASLRKPIKQSHAKYGNLPAIRTAPGEPEYQALLAWPFAAQPFYEKQVLGLLQNDIPNRVMLTAGRTPGMGDTQSTIPNSKSNG